MAQKRVKTAAKKLPKHHHSTYKLKRSRVRVAHHKHTGRWLPFYCTSYAIVFFLIIFAGALILFTTHATQADSVTGSIELKGVINGPPPEVPAKITSPASGTEFTSSQVEVRGTCLQDTYVEMYRKGTFAGMTQCSAEGTFQIIITLVPGANDIVAKIRDNLGRYGPDSEAIQVILKQKDKDNQAPQSSSSSPSQTYESYEKVLLVYTPPVQRGLVSGQQLKLEYEIDGGTKPYTVSIDWGDGTPNTLINHDSIGNFKALHEYKKTGQMTVRISVIDAKGRQASIQTIVVVHNIAPNAAAPVKTCDYTRFTSNFLQYCAQPNKLESAVNYMWPALTITVLMTASFWVGERFMYRQLRHKM